MILAADAGGTKLHFALFEVVGNRLVLGLHKRYASHQFSSLEEAADAFLKESRTGTQGGQVEAACFGVAGPVVDGRCVLTNLGWTIGLEDLKRHLPDIKEIVLCNDLEALGTAVPYLPRQDFSPLAPLGDPGKDQVGCPEGGEPVPQCRRMGVLMPGTGLGEALILDGKVYSSEGAHCEFGPRSIREAKLWRFLFDQLDHVSYERILSGEGLCRLVEFLMSERGLVKSGFPMTPEEIVKRAQGGDCDLCGKAVELFASILGAEAGNLALKALTLDGIYLGGNIVLEILPWLKGIPFMDAFRDKGRFAYLMENIPVYAILEKNAALWGCGLLAASKAGHMPTELPALLGASRMKGE